MMFVCINHEDESKTTELHLVGLEDEDGLFPLSRHNNMINTCMDPDISPLPFPRNGPPEQFPFYMV